LKYRAFFALSLLEVASQDLPSGEDMMEEVVSRSVQDSVYRNQTLQISFEAGTKDEYGDIEKPEQLRVTFSKLDPVSDDDLIIDEEVRRVLLRNVVDLHERRELLKAYQVPIRRGVLLYGPPGTGKTYTCRYLCGKLPNATRIMVAGSALFQVGKMFQLARLLQPAVLFLEDVDLVFMNREVSLYSSLLGDLLDHMDGLRPFEDIGFVLTTNAIDRMEAAVRDRPGRISQCISFGPPTPELRRRYLSHYLGPYDCRKVDLARLVGDSEGATQAFLKEWIHRAVQVGSERVSNALSELELRTDDFGQALREMRSFTDKSSARIIGFHR
jgi:SpoVK/Ycf46/Vps4 family AAA+-type ATPase